jgi:hypothetical protein
MTGDGGGPWIAASAFGLLAMTPAAIIARNPRASPRRLKGFLAMTRP